MRFRLVIFLAFILIPLWSFADLSTSTSFIVERGVIDSGGGTFATSNGFNLRTSIGQPGTGISSSTSFTVRGGFLNFFAPLVVPPPPTLRCIDFNSDRHVDIVDLSIILFHYNERGSNLGCYDLNRNGAVDFPDISILMYYWTG